jgi:hypothetical protein
MTKDKTFGDVFRHYLAFFLAFPADIGLSRE